MYSWEVLARNIAIGVFGVLSIKLCSSLAPAELFEESSKAGKGGWLKTEDAWKPSGRVRTRKGSAGCWDVLLLV